MTGVIVALAVGAMLISVGTWLAWLPVSDKYVQALADHIEANSGERAPHEELYASVKSDRVRLGARTGAVGLVLVVGGLVVAASDSGLLP